MFAFKKVVMVCACAHSKRDHWCTKLRPQGSCLVCPCSAFIAEAICKCGHGKKAHTRVPVTKVTAAKPSDQPRNRQ